MNIKNKLIYLFAVFFAAQVSAQTTSETLTSGTSYTIPAGVTKIRVEAWGGGGGGSYRNSNGDGAGGGGGAYSSSILTVTPGTAYSYSIGAGGSGASGTNPGGDSWFGSNTTLMAQGGRGAANNDNTRVDGGLAASSIGATTRNGGRSAAGSGYGGGGGSSATDTAVGNFTNNTTTQSAGGTVPGGTGGSGGAGRTGTQGDGSNGSAPGGGGGGSYRTSSGNRNGGDGASGQIRITYLSASITGTTNIPVGGTSQLSNSVSGGTWSSSNNNIAAVNPATGVVTGVSGGTTAIIYTTADGLARSVTVTVGYIIQTENAAGNGYTFTVPAGVTAVKVEAWGAGGRGASRTSNGVGAGGGGGGYSRGLYNVTPGAVYYYTVGAGGNANNNTAAAGSWFNATNTNATPGSDAAGVLANGGTNRADNSNTASTGGTVGYGNQAKYAGGAGAAGPNNSPNLGGGGGSSAGSGGDGNAATGTPGAVAPADGGSGGAGRAVAGQGPGSPGTAPGGGGGGAYRAGNDQNGGNGANGQIRITYLPEITGTAFVGVGGTTHLYNDISGGLWSSSNTGVAAVNPSTGVVTGVAEGSAVITYTTSDGLSRTITVMVGKVVQTITTTGTGTFKVPDGVNVIKVEAWGGGGKGSSRTLNNNSRGGGGGGGGYSSSILSVTPGTDYYYQVGAGSTATVTPVAANTWFNNVNNQTTANPYVLAIGGASLLDNTEGGAAGAAVGFGNQTLRIGGNGAGLNSGNNGSGGGSSGGPDGDGITATTSTGASGAAVGGGNGGNGSTGTGNGGNGNPPGGGGGGARRGTSGSQTGGNGANGQLIISYLPPIKGVSQMLIGGQSSTLSNVVAGGTWSCISGCASIASVNSTTGVVTTSGTAGTAVIQYSQGGLTQTKTIQVLNSPNPADLDSDNDGIPDCTERRLDAGIDKAFNLNNYATKINDYEARLTQAVNNQNGQMWSYGKVDFRQDFTIEFEARLSANSNDNGADGIAIVFQNDPKGINAGTNTTEGSSIGARGIENGIVLEIDTYFNNGLDPATDPPTDPATGPDHIHIWKSDDQTSLVSPVIFDGNIEDGNWKKVYVNWVAATGTMTFTVNGGGSDGVLGNGGTKTITYTNTNIKAIFGGADLVHFGYTSSTGALNNEHSVRFPVGLCNLPLGIDTDNDGIPDYLDLDSDGDGCPDALEGDGNITKSQLNPNGSISGGTDANGIPLAANGGQGAGSAYNAGTNTCHNPADLDSDNDGIPDFLEGGPLCIDSRNNTVNTPGYLLNTPFNSTRTTTPVTINNLANGSFNFTASLVGTLGTGANQISWNATANSGQSGSSGGIQIKDNYPAVGPAYIYMQPIGTSNNGTRYAKYELDFPTAISGFSFVSAGLNSYDTFEIYAFNGVTPVPITTANLSNFVASTSDNGGWLTSNLGDGVKVVGQQTGGGTDVNDNTFVTTINEPITHIEIRSYKNDNGSSTVSVGLTSISYCTTGPYLDTDGDGIPDYLDLDSDGDGCPDAIEGGDNVQQSHLNSDGSINIESTGGTNSDGIPNLVNPGGAADVDNLVAQGLGSSRDAAINGCYCTKPGTSDTPGGYTKVGILTKNGGITNSSLVSGVTTKWPENVPNGHIVMDSENKGFVITHMTTIQRDALAPVKGMMIYNTTLGCVQIYRGTTAVGGAPLKDPSRDGWQCIERGCND